MRSIEFGSYPRYIEPQKERFVEKKEPAVTESEGGDLKQTGEETGEEEKEEDSKNPERAVEYHKVAGDASPFPLKQSLQELFDQAVKLHDRGVEGDAEAVKKAYSLLTTLRLRAPQNALVEAYYGSVTALLGRDAIDPNERFQKAMKGLKTLDRAVATDPGNVQIRILRAYVGYRLPEMYFHRTKTAIEDFSYLVSRYEKDPGVFSREFYWQLLYDLGAAYKRLEQHREADATWSRLLSIAEDPKYKNLLQSQEFKLSGEARDTGFENTSGPEAKTAPAKKKRSSSAGRNSAL